MPARLPPLAVEPLEMMMRPERSAAAAANARRPAGGCQWLRSPFGVQPQCWPAEPMLQWILEPPPAPALLLCWLHWQQLRQQPWDPVHQPLLSHGLRLQLRLVLGMASFLQGCACPPAAARCRASRRQRRCSRQMPRWRVQAQAAAAAGRCWQRRQLTLLLPDLLLPADEQQERRAFALRLPLLLQALPLVLQLLLCQTSPHLADLKPQVLCGPAWPPAARPPPLSCAAAADTDIATRVFNPGTPCVNRMCIRPLHEREWLPANTYITCVYS